MTPPTDSYIDDLSNLLPSGKPPETRIASAAQAQAMFDALWRADQIARSPKRARVKGLVDGNPPYKYADLKNAGRARDCNVNWRVAESYLNNALGAFYDIFSEVPTYAKVMLDLPDDPMCEDKSRVVTEEFDRIQKREPKFDYNMQISQHEMVLYGFGPFVFDDEFDWRPSTGKCGEFYVPEGAKSNTESWDYCMMQVAYLPHKLYEYIVDEKAAREMGWDVEAVKAAIMNAMPRSSTQTQNWEWYQQQLKSGSFYYSQQSKKIFSVHVWFREFPDKESSEGRISHKIFLENQNINTGITGKPQTDKFLFSKIGQYSTWDECVHAMYYDHGGGGEHYSVTGMGVKMYAAMEYQNRLLCKLADDAFAPKTLFKPLSASQSQRMNLVTMGNYGVLPNGWDMVQQAVNPMMEESLAFNREVGGLLSSNLSQYRQDQQKTTGNPVTATEAQISASEQARLGKTQLNRYYEQLDKLYAEKYRRLVSPRLLESMPGGKSAKEFIKRCKDRGVTIEELRKIDSVKSTRVVGQGSPYMREASLQFILGMVAMLPEDGRSNLIDDIISSKVGNYAVKRYNPKMENSTLPTEQESQALDKVAGMKVGVPAIVTSVQNPLIYAQTYLQAASEAVGSLEQGANMSEVYNFLSLVGPAIAAQLQRLAIDPTRKEAYDQLNEQFTQLAKITDQIGKKLQQDAQRQAEEQQQAQNMLTMQQVEMMKAQQDLQIKQAKAEQALVTKQEKHNQSMATNDAKTAQQLILDQARTEADIAAQKEKAAAQKKSGTKDA